jgi:hypothetical protein
VSVTFGEIRGADNENIMSGVLGFLMLFIAYGRMFLKPID